MPKSCALCQTSVQAVTYQLNDLPFCCPGCKAVYSILSVQNKLSDFKNHTLYKEARKAGILSNPELLTELKNEAEVLDKKRIVFEITDLWCPSCQELIEWMLLKQKGVSNAFVDYSTDFCTVDFSPRDIDQESIFSTLDRLGYTPQKLENSEEKRSFLLLSLRFGVAAFFSLNIMMFSYPIYASYYQNGDAGYAHFLSWISFGFTLPVLFFSGWPIFKRCWSGIKNGFLGMESLVTFGVIASLILSLWSLFNGGDHVYFDSLTVIITLVLLGKLIEGRSKSNAKETLLKVRRGLPKKGRRKKENGGSEFVFLKEVQLSDRLLAFTGEKIVLDGIVKEGSALVSEAVITGEAIPLLKKVGDPLIAGSVIKQGWVSFEVTKREDKSTLSEIYDLIDEGMQKRHAAPSQVDNIAHIFVPLVALLALSTFLIVMVSGVKDPSLNPFETALTRLTAIFLIACPCAIGIAAPLAESRLIEALLKEGVLLRQRRALPFLGNETIFVFDKTGTLTEGNYHVLNGLESITPEEKPILKSMAEFSTHPASKAISQALSLIPSIPLQEVTEIAGYGMRAVVGGSEFFLGSARWFLEKEIPFPVQKNEDPYQTSILFGKELFLPSQLILGDRKKEGIATLLQSLKGMRTILLSGDNQKTVDALAKDCGIQEAIGGASPLIKQQLIEDLKTEGEIVAMVGDGINDAPSLASAHVSIVPKTSSDVSYQVADLVLTTDQIASIAQARTLAKKAHKITNQNLFWAFVYNILGIGLAAFGMLSPLFAAFAMTASSLTVLFNSKRIRTYDIKN